MRVPLFTSSSIYSDSMEDDKLLFCTVNSSGICLTNLFVRERHPPSSPCPLPSTLIDLVPNDLDFPITLYKVDISG